MKKVLRRLIISVISVLLVLCMVAPEPVRLIAGDAHTYVSEVKMAKADSADAAKNELESQGYTVLDNNLGEGNGGNYIYLGYKTTTDKDEAITDIRMMNMNGGFTIIDYEKDLAQMTNDRIKQTAAELKLACTELRDNLEMYDNGEGECYFADLSRSMMQGYIYNDTSLDEYLLSADRTDDDYIRLVSIASAKTLSMIFYTISIGLTDSTEDGLSNSLKSSSMFDTVINALGAINEDEIYANKASEIISTVKDFADNYKSAVASEEADKQYIEDTYNTVQDKQLEKAAAENTDTENEITTDTYDADTVKAALDEELQSYENSFTENDTVNDYSTSSIFIVDEEMADDEEYEQLDNPTNSDTVPDVAVAKSKEDAEAQETNENLVSQHLTTLGVYEKLKKISTPDTDTNKNFGDWILKAAELYKDGDELKALRMLYPLIQSLTESQINMIKLIGFENYMMMADENTKENYDKLIVDFGDEYKSNKLSVLSDVETDVYSLTVASTDSATRAKAAGKLHSALSKDNDSAMKTYMMKLQKQFAIALGVIAVAGITLGIIHFGIKASLTQFAVMAVKLIKVIAIEKTICCATVGWILGGINVILLAAAVATCVVMLIIWLVNYIKEKKRKNKVTYTTVPDIMFDDPNGKRAKYYAITNGGGKGSGVDLCDFKGWEWDVMYYTKSQTAGSPIEVYNGTAFSFGYSDSAPEKMIGVRRFQAETAPANLGRYIKNSSCSKYLYFYTEDSIAGVTPEPTEETEYISDIKMYTKDNAQQAIAALEAEEYTVVDQNLTPGFGKASYIGYKTTTSVTNAVRDIRVGYKLNVNLETGFMYGDAKYACSGTTCLGQSVHYSSDPCTGTPILAKTGIKVFANRDEVPDNFAPVNLFCGGDAYDFRYYDGYNHDFNGNPIMLYFEPEPEEAKDGEKDVEYLGGIAFVIAYRNDDGSIASRDYEAVKLAGFEVWEDAEETRLFNDTTSRSLVEDIPLSGGSCSNIMIYKTKNRYKAITDIWCHTTSVSATTVITNVAYGATYYAACDLFYTDDTTAGYISPIKAYVLGQDNDDTGLMSNLNYITIGYNTPTESTIGKYKKDNFKGTAEGGAAPSKTLYVSGPSSTKKPLKMSEIKVSKSTNEPQEGWRGVCDFGNSYETKATDLYLEVNYNEYADRKECQNVATSLVNPSTHFYMFIARKQAEKPRYVKNINVVSTSINGIVKDGEKIDSAKEAQIDETIKNIEEQCFFKALAQGEGTIIKQNLAVPYNNQLYKEENGKILRNNYLVASDRSRTVDHLYENCSYIFVKYTDATIGSLRDMMIVKEENCPEKQGDLTYQLYDYINDKPATEIVIEREKRKKVTVEKPINVTYKCAGEKIFSRELGYYYLYYSTNTSQGLEKSDITVSKNNLEFEAKTVQRYTGKSATQGVAENNTTGSLFIHMKQSDESMSAKDNLFAVAVFTADGYSEQEALNKLYNMKYTFKTDPVTGKTLSSPYTVTVDYVTPYNYATNGIDRKYAYIGYTIAPSTKYNRIITGLGVSTRYIFASSSGVEDPECDYYNYPEMTVYNPITKTSTKYDFINTCQGDLGRFKQYEMVDRNTSSTKGADGKYPYETKEEVSTVARSISAIYDPAISSGVDISTVTVTDANKLPITDDDTDKEREIAELINNNPSVYLRQIKSWDYFLFDDKQTFNSVYDIFMKGANDGIKWVAAPCSNLQIIRNPDNPGGTFFGFKIPKAKYEYMYYDSSAYYIYTEKETNHCSTIWYQTVESKKRSSVEVEDNIGNLKYLISKASGSVFGEGSVYMAVAVGGILLAVAIYAIIKRKKISETIDKE